MVNVSEFPHDIQWKPIIGYKLLYEVSNYGHVRTLQSRRSIKAGHILSPQTDKAGYQFYQLTKDGKKKGHAAHRLVFRAFVGIIPSNQEIDHIDSNKFNNHYSNLQILTHKENIEKANKDRRFRRPKGSELKRAKLTEQIVLEVRRRYAKGEGITALAREYDVTHVAMSLAVHGRTWRHVADQLPMFQEAK